MEVGRTVNSILARAYGLADLDENDEVGSWAISAASNTFDRAGFDG